MNLLYKSFNNFVNLKSDNYVDYFSKSIYTNFLKFGELKKKENIFFKTLLNNKKFYMLYLNNIWLLEFFLNLRKVYIQSLALKSYTNIEYLNIYYYFLKKNLIFKVWVYIKLYLIFKLKIKFFKKFDFFKFCSNFMFVNLNNVLQFNKSKTHYYNKYNNFKLLKTLFVNKEYVKLNRYLFNFKKFKEKNKLKLQIPKFIKSLKYTNLYYFNKLNFSLKNNNVGFKYKINLFNLLKFKNNRKELFIKLNFFLSHMYKLYINKYFNYSNKSNIILKYYFYFYNFIIKIFIKLLNNFKFIMFNKNNIIIKKFIWFKVFLIFLYYKKIFIYKKILCNKYIKLKKKKSTI